MFYITWRGIHSKTHYASAPFHKCPATTFIHFTSKFVFILCKSEVKDECLLKTVASVAFPASVWPTQSDDRESRICGGGEFGLHEAPQTIISPFHPVAFPLVLCHRLRFRHVSLIASLSLSAHSCWAILHLDSACYVSFLILCTSGFCSAAVVFNTRVFWRLHSLLKF